MRLFLFHFCVFNEFSFHLLSVDTILHYIKGLYKFIVNKMLPDLELSSTLV